MNALADELSVDFSVVTYDRRGRGASADTRPYSVDKEVDDIAALLEVVDESAILFGMSSGGALATLAASRLEVAGLIVYEPPYMPPAMRPSVSESSARLAAALEKDDRDLAVATFLERVGVPESVVAGMKQSPAWSGLTAIAPTLGYDDQVMADMAVPTIAEQIAVPAFAIAGGESPEALQWGARQLAERIPDAAFMVLDGQGHDVATQPLAGAIRNFVHRAD